MRGSILFPIIMTAALGATGCASSELLRAASRGDEAGTDYLLSQGSKVEETAITGCQKYPENHLQPAGYETPLICASIWGHSRIAKLLLDRGANPNAKDHMQRDALYYAAQNGNAQIVSLLLAKGADKTANAGAAVRAAERTGQADVIRLLGGDAAMIRTESPVAAAAPAAAASARVGVPAAPAVSDVDQASYRSPENGDNFALVVGVERYESLPPAEFAERDASAVRAHLLALGYPQRNIAYMVGSQASFTNIKKYVESWLPNRVNDKSTVFVYYSGHGAPDTKTNQAYLVPFSGDPEYLEDTAYPVARLYSKLGELKAKTVIVALDSCFSGSGGRSVLAKGTRPLVAKVDMGRISGDKIVSLSASAGSEISGTIEEQGHGAFTYFLLKGINGAAKDESGKVTIASLYDYLRPKVQDTARLSNRDQTPQLSPAKGGSTSTRIR